MVIIFRFDLWGIMAILVRFDDVVYDVLGVKLVIFRLVCECNC